jgi:hypothetical protein
MAAQHRAICGLGKSPGAAANTLFALFAFVRARPDAIVRRLPVHCGPRNAFDLASYVINDGQLLGRQGEVDWEFLCW